MQLLSTPTTDHGALLDHVYYNGNVEGVVIAVVDCYYSDHDTVFIFIPTATSTVVSHSTTCAAPPQSTIVRNVSTCSSVRHSSNVPTPSKKVSTC